jgi:tetratricopeptide (TPR) repeat protein
MQISNKLRKKGIYGINSEESFKKAIMFNPGNDRAYTGLGILYRQQNRLPEAEESFKKAIALNSGNNQAYTGLGLVYRYQNRLVEDEELFKKAIRLNPKNDWAYIGLGMLYREQGRLVDSEKLFKKAIRLNPKNDWTYTGLGMLYHQQGRLTKAEEYLKKAIALNSEDDRKKERGYRALESLYREMNRNDLAQEYSKKAANGYSSLTINNYRRLKAILDKRGILLVCVQYPMRRLEPLKKIFAGQTGVIFVDNEKLFKDAVARDGYREYFKDMFGGDFGHCTAKGNRLLAENIADTILKNVSEK